MTDQMDFIIEPAQPGDEVEIAEMIHEMAEFMDCAANCKATPESLAARLFGPSPSVEVGIVRHGEESVGYCLFFLVFSSFQCSEGLYLEDLYIRPAYRNRGLGTECLRYLARICLERGYPRMSWTSIRWSEPAIAHYKRIGARPKEEDLGWRMNKTAMERLVAGESLHSD